MAAPRLKVNAFDFSPYLRTQPDESPAMEAAGMDYFNPQFSGAPALGEGQSWVGDAVSNRTMVFPLYFTGETRAAILKLIREADEALVKGAQVEFNIDPDTDQSSFFDLERGKFESQFNFYHLINAVAGGVLTLYVRPFANTATHRLIASIPAATSAVVEFPATGVMGDTYSLANLEVRVGSQVASAGRVIAWGVHPHPSHNPYRAATSGLAQTGATVRGASGAIGSQYTAIPVSPTGASGIAYTAYLDPPSAHVGRHRVIAIGRSALSVPIPLYAEDRFGAILGATAIASQTDVNKWQVIDLGEVNVPARASGQDSVPTQYVNIYGGGASGAAINASPGFHLNGLLFLPLDYSAGILRTAGGLASVEDSFKRFTYESYAILESQPQADSGANWTNIAGRFEAVRGAIFPASGIAFTVPKNASALYALASGMKLVDVAAQINVALTVPATKGAASAAVTLWPKAFSNASTVIGGVGAKLQFGPSQTLQLVSASANGATAVVASAGIASTLASGLYEGQSHTLTVRVKEGRADVWLATGPLGASPILSASSAMYTGFGWPVVAANQGSGPEGAGVSAGFLLLERLKVSAYASTTDILPRNYFRFESHPEGRVYQGNASVFEVDRLAAYRGQFPKIPGVPSNSTATSAARVVVFQGEVDNVQGLDGPDISLTVLERNRFLRGG